MNEKDLGLTLKQICLLCFALCIIYSLVYPFGLSYVDKKTSVEQDIKIQCEIICHEENLQYLSSSIKGDDECICGEFIISDWVKETRYTKQ